MTPLLPGCVLCEARALDVKNFIQIQTTFTVRYGLRLSIYYSL